MLKVSGSNWESAITNINKFFQNVNHTLLYGYVKPIETIVNVLPIYIIRKFTDIQIK